MQSSSAGVGVESEASPSQPQKSQPPEETDVSEAVLRRRAYHKEWERNNPDKVKGYYLEKYAKTKEQLKVKRSTPEYKAKMQAYLKEYRAENAEAIKAGQKEWVENNKELLSEYKKDYAPRRRELYASRKEEICARKRELAKTPKYKARVQDYQRERRKVDPLFALAGSLRASVNRALRRVWRDKPARTEELIGCTIEFAKEHIEKQFGGDMSWENRSSFVVDHHCPIIAFNLFDDEEMYLAFNWKNMRPITRHENAVKGDKLPNPLPSWIPEHIQTRILERAKTL